jgi:hypothetical protein
MEHQARVNATFAVPFAIACIVGIVIGLYARTHDLLSPRPATEVALWTSAGYSPQDARRIVAFREVGSAEILGAFPIPSSKVSAEPSKSSASITTAHSTALYSGLEISHCDDLNPDNGTAEYANAFARYGKPWRMISDATSGIADQQRIRLLVAIWRALCE